MILTNTHLTMFRRVQDEGSVTVEKGSTAHRTLKWLKKHGLVTLTSRRKKVTATLDPGASQRY